MSCVATNYMFAFASLLWTLALPGVRVGSGLRVNLAGGLKKVGLTLLIPCFVSMDGTLRHLGNGNIRISRWPLASTGKMLLGVLGPSWLTGSVSPGEGSSSMSSFVLHVEMLLHASMLHMMNKCVSGLELRQLVVSALISYQVVMSLRRPTARWRGLRWSPALVARWRTLFLLYNIFWWIVLILMLSVNNVFRVVSRGLIRLRYD